MLSSVSITNYALIDKVELQFDSSFNIITGETGAGKSVLLGALGLVLGQRSDTGALFDKSRKCIVEARFNVQSASAVRDFLIANDFERTDPVIVRRELSPEGRSRAFINDTPASLQQLKEIGSMLVDIHSQHETLMLNRSDFQLSVLDALAGIQEQVKEFGNRFRDWQILVAEIASLEEQQQKAAAEQDYLKYQFDELSDASIREDEQFLLEDELLALSNSGSILEKLEVLNESLGGEHDNLVQRLIVVSNGLQHISKFGHGIPVLHDRLKSVVIELKDIQSEATAISGSIQPDPARMSEIESRLDLLYRLQKKHRVNSNRELLSLMEEFQNRIGNIDSIGHSLSHKRTAAEKMLTMLTKDAAKFSISRKKAAPLFEKTIRSMMVEVSLPNATFSVELGSSTDGIPGPSGTDKARFLFSANKGVLPAEIGKSASGGELSRLMLCIKAAVADSMDLPVMVFDEIDTGISGETALRMGKVMKRLSEHHQLIAITHLPQIASQGAAHYFVRKRDSSERTVTEVIRLSEEERIQEIARMLSGENPTPAAVANAKELLAQ